MADIWKKCLTNPGGMRVILAFLYLFAAFGIPRSHTCQLVDKDMHHRHSGFSSQLFHSDSYIEVHHIITFNQNSLSDKTDSHELDCPACLFSLTSKAFKLCSNTSLYSTQTVLRTQVLPQLSFIKQIDGFCSAPPRAPPNIAS